MREMPKSVIWKQLTVEPLTQFAEQIASGIQPKKKDMHFCHMCIEAFRHMYSKTDTVLERMSVHIGMNGHHRRSNLTLSNLCLGKLSGKRTGLSDSLYCCVYNPVF